MPAKHGKVPLNLDDVVATTGRLVLSIRNPRIQRIENVFLMRAYNWQRRSTVPPTFSVRSLGQVVERMFAILGCV